MQRGAKRNREAKSKKSIAIDMQHCIKTVTAQREKKGGMERLFYTSQEPFERQRKIEREDKGEGRVEIERKDLFDVTREKERKKERMGQEADENGIVMKKEGAIRDRQKVTWAVRET